MDPLVRVSCDKYSFLVSYFLLIVQIPVVLVCCGCFLLTFKDQLSVVVSCDCPPESRSLISPVFISDFVGSMSVTSI